MLAWPSPSLAANRAPGHPPPPPIGWVIRPQFLHRTGHDDPWVTHLADVACRNRSIHCQSTRLDLNRLDLDDRLPKTGPDRGQLGRERRSSLLHRPGSMIAPSTASKRSCLSSAPTTVSPLPVPNKDWPAGIIAPTRLEIPSGSSSILLADRVKPNDACSPATTCSTCCLVISHENAVNSAPSRTDTATLLCCRWSDDAKPSSTCAKTSSIVSNCTVSRTAISRRARETHSPSASTAARNSAAGASISPLTPCRRTDAPPPFESASVRRAPSPIPSVRESFGPALPPAFSVIVPLGIGASAHPRRTPADSH